MRSRSEGAAEAVSAQADRLILMTATPHRGKDADFWALMRLLDPHVFADRAPKEDRAPDASLASCVEGVDAT